MTFMESKSNNHDIECYNPEETELLVFNDIEWKVWYTNTNNGKFKNLTEGNGYPRNEKYGRYVKIWKLVPIIITANHYPDVKQSLLDELLVRFTILEFSAIHTAKRSGFPFKSCHIARLFMNWMEKEEPLISSSNFEEKEMNNIKSTILIEEIDSQFSAIELDNEKEYNSMPQILNPIKNSKKKRKLIYNNNCLDQSKIFNFFNNKKQKFI